MRPSRVLAILALPVILTATLAGCVPEPTPSSSADPSSSPSSSPSATPEPSASGTPAPAVEPVTETCDQLVTAQQVYDYNPNFTSLGSFTPAAGSPAALAVADQGIACRWQNGTSSENIDLSVAHYTDDTAESRGADAAAGGAAPATVSGADTASFGTAGGIGTLTAIAGGYWITVSSTTFLTAEDAAPFAEAATSAVA